MKQTVSKVRAKRTKSREKRAGKAAVSPRTHRDHPAIGFAIAFLLWAGMAIVLGADNLFHGGANTEFLIPFAGEAVFLLAGLFGTGVFLEIVRPGILRHNSRILLLAVISLLAIVLAKGVLYAADRSGLVPPPIAVFALPYALAPLVATLLIDSTVAVGVGVWTSLVLALMVPPAYGLAALITGIVATVVTAQTAQKARRRSTVSRTGLVIGLTEIICVLAMTALYWEESQVALVVRQAGACIVSGLLSAVVTLVILPAFEALFAITTDITLLELSDLGHPLLQRLAIEAPGTYHHSLVVANLAQGAADEIGANSLLARVSAYFHDIGKLVKPGFFAENLQMRRNPHDELQPSMSTLVITSHVKEGLSLAMLHKLPAPVMRVISEHHGTSLLSCFHHKAVARVEQEGLQNGGQTNAKNTVQESDFRYGGPRPSSRESAIICLADAVEAASRTMEKTSPGHIENLVREIVNRRFEDGQLAHCGMTLAELERVQLSFVFTLTNMLHGRVPYPKDENRDKQQTRPGPAEPPEDRTATAPPGGPGRTAGQSPPQG